MIQITLQDYFMGRDRSHAGELTEAIKSNAIKTVALVNELLAQAQADGVKIVNDQVTNTPVASGWRPAGVNAKTANAATSSTHLTGEGVDIQDVPGSRLLAHWCLNNRKVLERLGLYCEDFRWTAGKTKTDPWCHFQTRAPKSGKRFYVPSTAPAQDPDFPAP